MKLSTRLQREERGRRKSLTAMKVTSIYVIVGGSWIFFSDELLGLLAHDRETFTSLSMMKGWLFITITASMLYWLIRRDVADITASRDYYLKVFEEFPALIWRSDADGTCDYFNATWLTFTGSTLADQCGDGWTAFVHPHDLEYCLRMYREAFALRQPFAMEYRLRRHDAEYRWISDVGRPFFTADGRFEGYIGSCYDVTEQKRAAEDIETLNTHLAEHAVHLESLNAELEAANSDLEAFNYTVSHDLRSPLSAIQMCGQMILDLDPRDRDELAHLAESIISQTERMDRLIMSLINLSRASRKELQQEAVGLSEMAEEICRNLRLSDPQRGIEFRIEKGITLQGDSRLLEIVLENLLGNAWKYTSRREAAVVELGAFLEGGRQVCFVRDNGVGFDMSEAQRIFDSFHRFHGNADFDGFGIGLATVKRIIERHGGRIWADAAVGKGATFYFSLR